MLSLPQAGTRLGKPGPRPPRPGMRPGFGEQLSGPSTVTASPPRDPAGLSQTLPESQESIACNSQNCGRSDAPAGCRHTPGLSPRRSLRAWGPTQPQRQEIPPQQQRGRASEQWGGVEKPAPQSTWYDSITRVPAVAQGISSFSAVPGCSFDPRPGTVGQEIQALAQLCCGSQLQLRSEAWPGNSIMQRSSQKRKKKCVFLTSRLNESEAKLQILS